MFKKHLFGLAMVSLASSQAQSFNMNDFQNQYRIYREDQQMKPVSVTVQCSLSFKDFTKRVEKVTIPNSSSLTSSITMKDWKTKTETGVVEGTAQSFPCYVYEEVSVEAPPMSFVASEEDQLTEEYVAERCRGLVKDACKDKQCTTTVLGVIYNTCDKYSL